MLAAARTQLNALRMTQEVADQTRLKRRILSAYIQPSYSWQHTDSDDSASQAIATFFKSKQGDELMLTLAKNPIRSIVTEEGQKRYLKTYDLIPEAERPPLGVARLHAQ